jgi:hypothetical protein
MDDLDLIIDESKKRDNPDDNRVPLRAPSPTPDQTKERPTERKTDPPKRVIIIDL